MANKLYLRFSIAWIEPLSNNVLTNEKKVTTVYYVYLLTIETSIECHSRTEQFLS